MGTVISNLKARFGVDTTDFKKGLKDGEKATADFKGAAGGALDEFATMFGVNMSGINSACNTANNSLKFVKQSLIAAAKGGDVMAISMKLLKFALVATGIGAIVVLLGSVIAYFTKSGEGSDKFAKMLAQLKSVLDNVVERLVAFGKGMVDFISGKFKLGIEEMGSAFKGMGAEIKEDWKAAGLMADALDRLEDREIALITSLEERKQAVAELRLAAKDLDLTEEERLANLTKAQGIIKTIYADQISVEKERLRLMKEAIALATTDPTDEQRKEIAEQEAKINGLLTEQASELRGLTRETNTLTKAIDAKFETLKKANEEGAKKLDGASATPFDATQLTIVQQAVQATQFTLEELGMVAIDVAKEVNGAFVTISEGMGEFFGALANGDAGMNDFGKMVGETFASMAIQIGKIAIAAGWAVVGIKKALTSGQAWAAIGAGIALVALGTAVKGALANAAPGGSSGGGSSSGSGSLTYDTRTSSAALKPMTVNINGRLVAEGRDLVYVFNTENNRKNITT